VHGGDFGVIDLHVCSSARLPNTCSRLRQSVSGPGAALNCRDCNFVELVRRRRTIGRVRPLIPQRRPLLGSFFEQVSLEFSALFSHSRTALPRYVPE
jgi:hypothetical protein